MHRRTAISLLAALLLPACQLPTGSVAGPNATQLASQPTKPPVSAAPAASPVTAALPSAAPSVAPASPDTTTSVSGLIRLNSAYVQAAGAGSVVVAGGGNVIAASGGNMISAGGGNLISAGGGNVVAAVGGNYRVLDVAPQELPVKGMVVAAVSLTTHELLAPAVYTDDTGRYTLAVPPSVQGNYAILAAFPGKSADDPVLQNANLRFVLVTRPNAQDQLPVLDEDASGLAYYLRNCMLGYLWPMLFGDATTAENDLITDWNLPPAVQPLVPLVIDRMRSKMQALQGLGTDQQKQVVQAVIDHLLAGMQAPDQLPLHSELTGVTGQATTAAGALEAVLQFLRQEADAKLAADPSFFASQDFVTQAGNDPATGKPYVIRNGADLERFVIKAYLTSGVSEPIVKTGQVMDALGGHVSADGQDQVATLRAATFSFTSALYTAFLQQQSTDAQQLPASPVSGAAPVVKLD